MALEVRPYPWGSIDSTTRADAAAFRAIRSWSASHGRLDGIASAVSEVLGGASVEFLLRRAQHVVGDSMRAMDDGVAVLVGPDGAADLRGATLIEIEGALATSVVSRLLRRPLPKGTDPAVRPSRNIAGAVAAVVAATVRRTGASAPPRILAAGPSATLLVDLARANDGLFAASFTALVAHEAFLVRVVVPKPSATSGATGVWGKSAVAALGAARIALQLVASATTASATDVAALRVGDAWMPGNWKLVRRPGEGRAPFWLSGPVTLAAPDADFGVSAEIGEQHALVVGGERQDLSTGERTMNEANDTDALIEAVGEVPVVVRVEIGSVEMRARDWAALGKGDVVALGRRVADPVELRVGGVVLARGELVEIDGEVGVRIVDRLGRVDGKETAT